MGLPWISVGWQEACGGMRAVQGPRGPARLALQPGLRKAVASGGRGCISCRRGVRRALGCVLVPAAR